LAPGFAQIEDCKAAVSEHGGGVILVSARPNWCASYLVEPTPDVVEHVARKRAIARLRAVKWEDLPLSKLGDVLAVIQ
jgi:hypothetical protein